MSRSVALKDSPLGQLPNEILLIIANAMPPNDRAAFSVSCVQIHAILDTNVTELRKEKNVIYWKFLNQLANDSPNHIACWSCKALHAIDSTRANIRQKQRFVLPCSFALAPPAVSDSIHPQFNSALAQMVMKLNRQGEKYDDILKHLNHPLVFMDDFGPLVSAEARIVGQSLIIRKQKLFVYHISEMLSSPSLVDGLPPEDLLWNPCSENHTDYTWFNTFVPAQEIIDRKFEIWQKRKLGTRKGLRRKVPRSYCPDCETEIQVDFQEFEGESVAVFLTAWQELDEKIGDDGGFGPCSQPVDPDTIDLEGGKLNRMDMDNRPCTKKVQQRFEMDGPGVRFEMGEKFIPASQSTKRDRRIMKEECLEMVRLQQEAAIEGLLLGLIA
ncbi:hypothetical protein EG329_009602 [Mollisiaceae sp. DMI_Dod_QoI]|nr:hypothetical protein EG329_009602 [Helotiales sp. DMI_Dod_QoI]